jgi:Copper amine oxidase N-terminal domain
MWGILFKRYILYAVLIVASASRSFADTATSMPMTSPPPIDFGSAPSGEVPILFNDQHVYARPDTLRHGRLLAALVKDSAILVPLRSMFEQMGATVSYDAATKSATASKPGSEVHVTLGKNEVLINGESRPLDVAPIMYQGVLLVPVRVISEALGAYVEWVPDQHLIVVRYVAATPVPTPPPTPVPTPVLTPAKPPARAMAPKEWQVSLTPYVWLPSINGLLHYDISQIPGGGSGTLSLSAGPSGYLNKLDSGLAFTGDAHNRYFDVFTDFLWMNLSNVSTTSATVTGPHGRVQLPVTFHADARLTDSLWTVGVGAPVFEDPGVTADLFLGFRAMQTRSSNIWTLTTPSPYIDSSGSASFTTTVWDLIGGGKMNIYLTPDKAWFIPMYADVGSGTFGSTWQYVGGIGYGRRGSVELVYRGLAYTSKSGPLSNLRLSGPALGYTFRF